jgi:hypothetical protein
MATLVSVQSGNFLDASTWDVVNATSFLDSTGTGTTVTTTPTNGTAFTPGAITISGILLQINDRASSPSGTFTVSLFNTTAGALVAGTTVTVNVSDLPITATRVGARGLGWANFKFAADVTLLAATNYAVRLSTSVASQIIMFTAATTNWSRGLVTTTNAAPAATDVLIVCGNYTGVGTSNSYAVTMNSTSASPVYGQIYIATKGTLSYGTASATNYILRFAGNMFVTREGSLIIGTLSVPIPQNSTARLEFNVASNNQFGLFISGGDFTSYGAERSADITLAANASAGATSVTLSSSPTGWSSGDTLGFASTTTNFGQSEVKNLTANVTSTTASIVALTNAHDGIIANYTQADVINLTRNIVITVGATTTLNTSVQITGYGTTVDCKYTAFLQCAGAALTNAGINIGTSAGNAQAMNIDIQYCSMYQATPIASGLGVYLGTSIASNDSSLTFSYNSTYGYSGASITLLSVSGISTLIWTNNVFMRGGTSNISNWIGTNNNNVFTSGSGIGVTLNTYSSGTARCFPIGPNTLFQNWRIYSNVGIGAQFQVGTITVEFGDPSYLTITNLMCFRNAGNSVINFSNFDMFHSSSQIIFDGAYFFGNTTCLVNYLNINTKIIFENSYLWSDRAFQSPSAVFPQANQVPQYTDYLHFLDCGFGISPTGGSNTFSTSIFRSDFNRGGGLMVVNPTFAGTVNTRNTLYKGNQYSQGIQVVKQNGVTGSNIIYTNSGNISSDSVIFRTSAPSVRITPAARYNMLSSPTVRIPVLAGESCTVTVWVRLSSTSDGQQYTSTPPKLIYRFNSMSGNLQDNIVATASSTNGVWQQLSYTASSSALDAVLEFYVECDGSAGWINVDDWDTSSVNDSRGNVFFSNYVGVYTEPDFGAGGASYTFIN